MLKHLGDLVHVEKCMVVRVESGREHLQTCPDKKI